MNFTIRKVKKRGKEEEEGKQWIFITNPLFFPFIFFILLYIMSYRKELEKIMKDKSLFDRFYCMIICYIEKVHVKYSYSVIIENKTNEPRDHLGTLLLLWLLIIVVMNS